MTMLPAQARLVVGARMRAVRESARATLTRTAARSGWDKGHLSRVERGSVKPSRPLVEWYDSAFGEDGALVDEFLTLEAAVRDGRDRALRAAHAMDHAG